MKTPTHVICPAEEDIPGKLPEYLTAGKTYEVATLCAEDDGFDFIGDDGHLTSGLWKECAHLNGADWIPVYADEESMVEAQSVTTWADVGPGLLEALRECREYFDQRADADQPSGLQPIPNEEATILVGIDAAIASAEKVESHE